MSREHRTVIFDDEQQARHEEIRRQVERDKPRRSRLALRRKAELDTLIEAFHLLQAEWERRCLGVADVAERCGMDAGDLAIMAGDAFPPVTLSTLSQIADGIGVRLTLGVEQKVA